MTTVSTTPNVSIRSKVSGSSVFCSEDTCCWYDCQYSQIVCGQQNGSYASVDSTLDGYNLDGAPDWWRSERYYLVSNYEMNVLSGRGSGLGSAYFYVGKFCEGPGEDFNTCYTIGLYYAEYADFTAWLLAQGENGPVSSGNCSDALSFCPGFCTPACAGRECGSDGCFGTCGDCSLGSVCNSQGQCVSDSGGNSCDDCLSTCRGLPGCCMGCGCMCQDECGMCF